MVSNNNTMSNTSSSSSSSSPYDQNQNQSSPPSSSSIPSSDITSTMDGHTNEDTLTQTRNDNDNDNNTVTATAGEGGTSHSSSTAIYSTVHGIPTICMKCCDILLLILSLIYIILLASSIPVNSPLHTSSYQMVSTGCQTYLLCMSV